MMDWQTLKQKALAGDLDSVRKLHECIPTLGIRPEQVLQVYYHVLDSTKIPHPSKPIRNTVFGLAMTAGPLAGISTIIDQYSSQDDALLSNLKEHWPLMWKWIDSLLNNGSPQPIVPTNDEARGQLVYVQCMHLLGSLAWAKDARDTMANAPGFIKTMVSWWIAEAESANNYLPISSSGVFERFVSAPKAGWLDQIVQASGNNPALIAKCLLRRIRTITSKAGDLASDRLSLNSLLLTAMGFANEENPVRSALLSQNSVHVIATAFFRICAEKNPTLPASDIVPKMALFCIIYLELSIDGSDDACTWVVQVLEAHILEALINSMPWFEEEPALKDCCQRMLGETIPKYTLYRSGLRAAGKAAKVVRRLKLDFAVKRENSPLREQWKVFDELVKERLAIKVHYDNEPLSHAVCSNPKCEKVDTRDQFKRCSGCLTSFFCSTVCSREAWKLGHRALCKSVEQRRFDQEPEPLSNKDMASMTNLALYDRYKYSQQLQELKVQYLVMHPSENRFTLVTMFDYTKIPVSIDVVPPEKCRNARDEEFLTSVERAKTGEGKYTLLAMHIPRGLGNVELCSLHPEEEVLRDSGSSKAPVTATVLEEFGLTEDEYSKIQPRLLQFYESQSKTSIISSSKR